MAVSNDARHRQLFETWLRSENPDDAIRAVNNAITGEPSNPSNYLDLADLCLINSLVQNYIAQDNASAQRSQLRAVECIGRAYRARFNISEEERERARLSFSLLRAASVISSWRSWLLSPTAEIDKALRIPLSEWKTLRSYWEASHNDYRQEIDQMLARLRGGQSQFAVYHSDGDPRHERVKPQQSQSRGCVEPSPLMRAEGTNGVVELFQGKVRLTRKGWTSLLTHGLQGEKDILISRISSIQIKSASQFINGYIQFAFMGGVESKAGIFQAAADENTVVFNDMQQPAFDQIKRAIETQMDSGTIIATASSNLDDLQRLASLRDKGIVTQEEFDAKKKQLLGLD